METITIWQVTVLPTNFGLGKEMKLLLNQKVNKVTKGDTRRNDHLPKSQFPKSQPVL